MKGLGTTYDDAFMNGVLGGQVTLDEAKEQLGEAVFERWLRGEDQFEALVDQLLPSAIAAGIRRSAKRQGVKLTWETALSLVDATKRKDPSFSVAMRGLVAQDLQIMVAFQLAGQQTYRFAINLSDRLIRTNIDVPARLFKLPHKCFQTIHQSRDAIDVFCRALEVLKPRLSLTEGSANGGSLSTIVSIVEQGIHGGRQLQFNYKLHLPTGGRVTSRSLMVTLPLEAEGDERLPDIIASRAISLPQEYEAPDLSDMELFDERVSALLRLSANSALYLVSANADVSEEQDPYAALKSKSLAKGLPAKQRKRAEHELLYTSKTKFRDVGIHFESRKFEDEVAAAGEPSGSSRKLTKRLVVSGHWKIQRYGPKRSQSKIIFVEPYSKGPEAADVVARNYFVPDKKRKIIGDITSE